MKEFIEKLTKKLYENVKSKGCPDETCWVHLNKNCDNCDSKEIEVTDVIRIATELAEEYKDINIITDFLQYVRDNAENYDADNGWDLSDLIDLSIKFCDAKDIDVSTFDAGELMRKTEQVNDGWISVEERLPEDCTIYEVTARFGNGMCYTEFAYYDESKGEWWKHDEDGLVNVLAWKEHSAPYQPKEQ